MDWLFLLIGSVCFVELFIRLDSLRQIRALTDILTKVARVIRSPGISDHWKEKILPSYALALFKQSLLIFVILVVCFLIFPLLGLVSHFLDGDFIAQSTSVLGIAATTCMAGCYAFVRSKTSHPSSDYGPGSKILHRIALGTPFVGEALFDIEKSLYGSKSRAVNEENHVFVSGLARAGTTILMRRLYESGQFGSLTYRDMPFALAPNLWSKMSSPSLKDKELEERAHGDGIMVDYDSPEALEEVFWKARCGSGYIQNDSLTPMAASEEIIDDFRTYVSLILHKTDKNRYLSKNNNNILRLGSLVEAFPQATILIPFRQPQQQAYSLLRQHRMFRQRHTEDTFSRNYMSWLAHHEFGSDHRPFKFAEQPAGVGDTDTIDYWLEAWIQAYTYVLAHLPEQAIPVCYETLCNSDSGTWEQLQDRLALPASKGDETFTKAPDNDSACSAVLLDQAAELYSRLCAKAIGSEQ